VQGVSSKKSQGGGLVAVLLVGVLGGSGYLVYQGMDHDDKGPATVASLGLKPQPKASAQPGSSTPGAASTGAAGSNEGSSNVGGGGLVVGGATRPDATSGGATQESADDPAVPGSDVVVGDQSGSTAPEQAGPDITVPDTTVLEEPAPEPVSPGSLVGKPVSAKGTSGATGPAATGSPVSHGDQVLSPGVWHAQPGCMYTLNGVQSAYIVGGTAQVEVRRGDSFWSTCGWSPGYAPSAGSRASIGMHVVGKDMAPGTWVADSTECSYRFLQDLRLSSSEDYGYTTREKSDFILKPGDIFLSNQECGGWTKVA
jgi:hypothetical protein